METFRGGIKKGTTAFDTLSKSNDKIIKIASKKISKELPSGLQYYKKIPKEYIPGGAGACEPDGGCYFLYDELVCVFEMKKQNDAGNAIDRWFKNNYICRTISPYVSYVTFACGDGAKPNAIIPRTLNIAHLKGFNQFNLYDNSLFLKPEGFTEVDKNNMSILLENQAKQLVTESNQIASNSFYTSGGQGENWAGIALPLVRKVFGTIVAKEFVSVQPMNMPSGLVFFLDFQYGNEKTPFTAGQSLYGNRNTASQFPLDNQEKRQLLDPFGNWLDL